MNQPLKVIRYNYKMMNAPTKFEKMYNHSNTEENNNNKFENYYTLSLLLHVSIILTKNCV